jgi:hypothetical protein
MTAEQRGMEMMSVKFKDLPPLAFAYMRDLASRMGMCMEVCLSAWTTYAQLEEGLVCTDGLYITPPDEVVRFNKLKTGIPPDTTVEELNRLDALADLKRRIGL